MLYIGDSKMEALDTRAHLVAGGNYQLRPLTAYELTASTLDGRPVAGFDEPITVQIQYRYDDLPEFLERTIGCFIWDEETEGWEISKAVVSPDQGVIQVQTEVTGIYAAAVTGLGTGGHYGTGPGRCASPYAQPTPSLFIDIPATFGQASIEEIEQRFGPSVERLPLDSDEEMVPLKGGEGRIYRVGNYGLIFMFDKQGIARGLQASLGYAGEKHALDDWAELLDRFNLHPDSSQGEFGDGGIFFRDAGGYDILMNSSISSYPFIADLWIMETGLLSQLLVDE